MGSDQVGLLAGQGRTLGMNAAEHETMFLAVRLQLEAGHDRSDHRFLLGIEDENFVTHGRHPAIRGAVEPLHFDGVAGDDGLGAHDFTSAIDGWD